MTDRHIAQLAITDQSAAPTCRAGDCETDCTCPCTCAANCNCQAGAKCAPACPCD